MKLYLIFVFAMLFLFLPTFAFAQAIPTELNIQYDKKTEDGRYLYYVKGTISSDSFDKSFYDNGSEAYEITIGHDVFDINEQGWGVPIVDTATGKYALQIFALVALPYSNTETVRLDINRLINDENLSVYNYNFGLSIDAMDAAANGEVVALPPAVEECSIPEICYQLADQSNLDAEVLDAPVADDGSPSISYAIGSGVCGDWGAIKVIDEFSVCFAEWGKKANQFLIAIGIVGSLFLLPMIGYLWASGQPGNIEKAGELFSSWMWGLGLLLLSGFIISIFGTDLFGVLSN